MFATRFQGWAYRHIAKPVFFRQDPENVHDRMVQFGKSLGRFGAAQRVVEGLYAYRNPKLEQVVAGIHFQNPVGLTAGFDKNAELLDILPSVGFGFAEVGSVTGEPCEGNPKPRLWRLPESRGLVVNYGLKNDGAEAIANRLRGQSFLFPVGISVAKTNSPATVELESGIADYVKAFTAFTAIGDYFTVNISCPNAFGGEPFADPARLDALLTALDPIPTTKSVFVKLGADLSTTDVDRIIDVVQRHRVHGFVLTNLLKDRTRPTINQEELKRVGKGGISGKPVFAPSNALIAHVFRTVGTKYVIIGSGGIFSAEDAYEKIRAGASLVQLATGMIFQGPQSIGEMNRGLVALLERDGYSHISDAVGSSASK